VNDAPQNHNAKTAQSSIREPLLACIILAIAFFAAAAVRLYNIDSAKLYFYPTRQYESFCIARQFYFESIDSVPDWQRQVAKANQRASGGKQPPITEYLVSLVYRTTGGESHWAPSVVSSMFWLIGGVFVFLIAQKYTPAVPAAVATAFYLVCPFGILMSRSFQPEALMTMMFLASVYTIFNYYEKQSTKRLLVMAVVSGLAVLAKVNIIFPIWTAFIAGGMYKSSFRKTIFSRRHLLFALFGIMPGFIYYFGGALFTGKLQMVAQSIYAPGLLLDSFFWTGWLNQLGCVVGYICLVGMFIGIMIVRDNLTKSLLTGLVVGYFFYGLIFTYTTATHDYYQVQAVPIVALALSPAIAFFLNRLLQKHSCLRRVTIIGGLLLLIVLLGLLVSIKKSTFRSENKYIKRCLVFGYNCFGLRPDYLSQFSTDYADFVETAKEIGRAVNHSDKTVTLGKAAALRYYGEYAGYRWPRHYNWPFPDSIGSIGTGAKWSKYHGLSAAKLFEEHFARFAPEYFIVAVPGDFEKQKSLKEFLYGKFKVLVHEEKYLIFDLTEPKE